MSSVILRSFVESTPQMNDRKKKTCLFNSDSASTKETGVLLNYIMENPSHILWTNDDQKLSPDRNSSNFDIVNPTNIVTKKLLQQLIDGDDSEPSLLKMHASNPKKRINDEEFDETVNNPLHNGMGDTHSASNNDTDTIEMRSENSDQAIKNPLHVNDVNTAGVHRTSRTSSVETSTVYSPGASKNSPGFSLRKPSPGYTPSFSRIDKLVLNS